MKEYSRTKNTVLTAITGIGGQLITSVLSFVSRTVFIQVLGASYLGIGGLFTNILSLLSLTELGLDTAINYKLYKPVAEHDEHRVQVLMTFFRKAYLVIGVIILVLGLMLLPALPFFIKDYDKLEGLGINAPLFFLLYLMQSVSSYFFFASRTIMLKSAQKVYVSNIVLIIGNIFSSIAQICVLLLFEDFLAYVVVFILFVLLMNGTNAFFATRMFPYAFKKVDDRLSREEFRDIAKDCGSLLVFKLNAVVLNASDNLVLSKMIGLLYVGLYSNYLLFTMAINRFLGHFYVSIKASLGNVFATEGKQKCYFLFEVMNFMTIVLNGTAALFIALCLNDVIEIWIGSDYLLSQPFPLLLGIQLLFNGFKINLHAMRDVTGIFQQSWYCPLLGSLINIVVSVVLCYYIGICGIIIGTITADLVTSFMIDPRIIHKYTFENYRSVSYYYRKNLFYLLILGLLGMFDYWLIQFVKIDNSLVCAIVRILFVCASVPFCFLSLYWKSDICQYMTSKIFRLPKKRI